MRRILVVGDVMLDVVVRPQAALAPTSDTLALIHVGRGGSAANLAVAARAAAEATFDVLFAGVAGDDAAVDIITDDLDSCGVTSRIVSTSGATGVVVSLVSDTGERAMMTDRGVNGELQFDHLAPLFDTALAHVHVSGYTALDVRTRSLVPRILASAVDSGVTSSIDACSVGPLHDVGVDVFLRSAHGATMLFANEEEAQALARTNDTEAALAILSSLFEEVVITCGPRGALTRVGDRTSRSPASPGEVLDTTGAGDSATGTYLAHRVAGCDVDSALSLAMDAAARVVRRLGSHP